jgi:Mrp family chromosome partitioning ATPase
MRELVATLRERYQVIVSDSPPLSAGVDPFHLGVATGRLVLVLRAGVSHRELAAAKLAVLGRMPVDLLGTVLNDVPADQAYGYYSYYLAGYELGSDSAHERAVVRAT